MNKLVINLLNPYHLVKDLFLLLLFLHISGLSSPLNGQNLIPNPGFEICDNCNNQGSVEFGLGKRGSNNPPDWFAATHGSSDIRSNEPRTGRRHGGFFAGSKYEYLSNHFESPLQTLSTYTFSFYAKAGSTTAYWVDELGVYIDFEENEYDIFTSLSRLQPQWTTPDGAFIDNRGFQSFSFEYLACGGESHFITGRFAELGASDTLYSGQGRRGSVVAYLIVDDYDMEEVDQFDFFAKDSLLFCGDTIITSSIVIPDSMFDIHVNGLPDIAEVHITGPGTYTFSATCKESGESYRDTLIVFGETLEFDLGADSAVCAMEEVMFVGPDLPGATYVWSNGDSSMATTFNGPGTVVLVVSEGCRQGSDTLILTQKQLVFDREDLFPKAFTPNNDMINDHFKIKEKYIESISPEDFSIVIFNRWGQQVFSSDHPDFQWDGGEYVSEVYLFTCTLRATDCEENETIEMISKDITLVK